MTMSEPDPEMDLPRLIDRWCEQPDEVVADELARYAKLSGCDCDPVRIVLRPFPTVIAVKLEHQESCMGLRMMRGMEGRN